MGFAHVACVLILLRLSALMASLYRRIAHLLKPTDLQMKGVTSFLTPGGLWFEVAGATHDLGKACGFEHAICHLNLFTRYHPSIAAIH